MVQRAWDTALAKKICLPEEYNYDENEPLKERLYVGQNGGNGQKISSTRKAKWREGYAWQGNHYEGLTCNVMEWLASDGITSRIIDGDFRSL